MNKRVLITGVTGQDGSFLAESLLRDGWDVYGIVRGQGNQRLPWLRKLLPDLKILSADLQDQMSLLRAVQESRPGQVYNLAGISAPGLGWVQPTLMADVTGTGAIRLMEAVVSAAPDAKFLQATSIALHGPYGAAKMMAQMVAEDYRARGYKFSCAVMAGHHSPRRGSEFFSRKVVDSAIEIMMGRAKHFTIGPLDRSQDWGHANNFVAAQRAILEQLDPGTYTIATDDPRPNELWVKEVFEICGLNWREYVQFDKSFKQPTDVSVLSAKPSPELLRFWTPNLDFHALAKWMTMTEKPW